MADEVDYSKPLKNSKYERFCQEYIIDNNKTQAAIRAGYSEKRADSRGATLWGIVGIRKRVAYLQAQISEATGVTAKMVVDGFKKIAFGIISETLTNKHKLRALENLAKHLGIYEKDNRQIAQTLAEFLKAMKDD
jgi:phage terminase small subunit